MCAGAHVLYGVFLLVMVTTFGPYGLVGQSIMTVVGVAMVLAACSASRSDEDEDAGVTLP